MIGLRELPCGGDADDFVEFGGRGALEREAVVGCELAHLPPQAGGLLPREGALGLPVGDGGEDLVDAAGRPDPCRGEALDEPGGAEGPVEAEPEDATAALA